MTLAIAECSRSFRKRGNHSTRDVSRIKCRSLLPESLKTISLSASGSSAPWNGLFLFRALLTRNDRTPKLSENPLTMSEESL